MYLPEDYYKQFVKEINEVHGGAICNEDSNTCKFKMPCSEVTAKAIEFSFRVYDLGESYQYQIPFSEMYVSGARFGDEKGDDACYIPVFNHGQQGDVESNLVMIGNVFMQKYYFVYDASPLE